MRMNHIAGFGYAHKLDFKKNKNSIIEFIFIKRDFDEGNQRRVKWCFVLGHNLTKAY